MLGVLVPMKSGLRRALTIATLRSEAAVVASTRIASEGNYPWRTSARFFSKSPLLQHQAPDDDTDDFVSVAKPGHPAAHDHHEDHQHADHDHSDDDDDDDDDNEDEDDMEDMVAIGPSGPEYGGPQRGGKFKEPTRYGDWERKGRCSDF